MNGDKGLLYSLLPRYLRFRDHGEGKPLETLMDALEIPLGALKKNIDALYWGWFIETCEAWQVPYIADLVGIDEMAKINEGLTSHRRLTANVIAYRRHKGIPRALARVAESATGWPCHAMEYRDVIATFPSLRDLGGSPAGQTWSDLRRQEELDRIRTPFNVIRHSLDLRLGEAGRRSLAGAFNPRTLGLAFWRLRHYPVRGVSARRMASTEKAFAGRFYTFHPFGVDTPLFSWPLSEDEPIYEAEPHHMPQPLSRHGFARQVAAWCSAGASWSRLGQRPPFRILSRESAAEDFRELAPQAMEIRDLSRWRLPPGERVAVDPELGRITFGQANAERQVRVDYCYGAPADVGGGPYPRRDPLVELVPGTRELVVTAGESAAFAAPGRHPSLSSALRELRALARTGTRSALIRIVDSGSYPVRGLEMKLPACCQLVIQAEEGCRPVLLGDFTVVGGRGSQLHLHGLWIEGTIRLREAELHLADCTVNPPRPGRPPRLAIEACAAQTSAAQGDAEPVEDWGHCFEIRIQRSILGALRLPRHRVELLEILDSIVDGGGGAAIQGESSTHGETSTVGPSAHLERTTIFGRVAVHQLWVAANVLFTDCVEVERRREGLVRFCYLPAGSRVPAGESNLEGGPLAFTSTDYGDPGYAQLTSCSTEVQTGGEHGDEIGVYHCLRQSYRLAILPLVLEAHLPRGFNAQVALIT